MDAAITGGCWSTVGPLETSTDICHMPIPTDNLVVFATVSDWSAPPALISYTPVTETVATAIPLTPDDDVEVLTMNPGVGMIYRSSDVEGGDDEDGAVRVTTGLALTLAVVAFNVLTGAGILEL
jgi:hypothetical protein